MKKLEDNRKSEEETIKGFANDKKAKLAKAGKLTKEASDKIDSDTKKELSKNNDQKLKLFRKKPKNLLKMINFGMMK